MAVALRPPDPAELAALAGQLDLGGTVAMAYPAPDPALCLLAFRDGEVAGFGFCLLERRAGELEGWVHDLGVAPAARGIGLGRALLWQGILAMRERGAARVLLGMDAANDRARRPYRRTGFRTTETFGYHRLALA